MNTLTSRALGSWLGVAALGVVIACGGGGGGDTAMGPGPGPSPPADPNPPPNPNPPPASPDVATIRMIDFEFQPADTTIPAGTTVRWVNTTNTTHTVTPDGHTQWSRRTTSSMETVLEQRLDTAGVFNYFCEPHRSIGMTGSITVQ